MPTLMAKGNVYRRRSGLGQYEESDLATKRSELLSLQAERARVEEEIRAVETGRPVSRAQGPAALADEYVSEAAGSAGIPKWAVVAGGLALAVILLRKK